MFPSSYYGTPEDMPQNELFRTRYKLVGENEAPEMKDLRRVHGESASIFVAPVFDSPRKLDFGKSKVYEKFSLESQEEKWREIEGGTERGRILRKYQDNLSEGLEKEAAA